MPLLVLAVMSTSSACEGLPEPRTPVATAAPRDASNRSHLHEFFRASRIRVPRGAPTAASTDADHRVEPSDASCMNGSAGALFN